MEEKGMVDNGKMRFAVAIVEARTAAHKARGDKRCGCGLCRHWVRMAAHWAGVPRKELEAVLPEPAKPRRRERRPAPRGMRAQICENGTIRHRGGDVGEAAGLAALFDRLHQQE
ncbi:MAG: hypothetical protein QM728_06450 [Gordonia sp. (in: high G+C Gram-positive bacteria)]|uniref:hypothetical protein n=1 Tax=Gordonia sp. (in: high G+C Gram-positive bacteria) TaxID=84139 RepID=UPI0039E3C126